MEKEAVRRELTRDPFIPIRLHLTDGRTFDVPVPGVAHMMAYGLLVMIGADVKARTAEGYDQFPFDRISRIEPLPFKSSGRRRKAS
jgi:hypothetical protein